MKLSINGINIIKHFEGLRLSAYQCSAGVWTIGYGHTKGVKKGQTISQTQADLFLISDVQSVVNALNKGRFALSQNQFDALTSFFFNLGVGRIETFKNQLLTNPSNPEITTRMKKYVYAKAVLINGLVTRREMESNLYLS